MEKLKPLTMSEALAALGKTEQSVSIRLRELGIHGYQCRSGNCPIANYFKKVCRLKHIVVDCTTVTWYRSVNSPLTKKLAIPEHVSAWIREFDGGKKQDFLVLPNS